MDKQYPEGLVEALTTLRDYCARNDYKGWDPYDGLNSRVFRAIPLIGRSAIIRLCWIQLFKRSPLNLRPLLLVPKQHNAKGVALAVQTHCEMYRAVEADPSLAEVLGTQDTLKAEISRLSQL
ncbi:MAG TPA: delta-aminolevulinic acid dehydratase, partial [Muribaculaceae bacterium]|nr:delta-aminolevulinic acid dehydratase [Muribaculaceae bacterium]